MAATDEDESLSWSGLAGLGSSSRGWTRSSPYSASFFGALPRKAKHCRTHRGSGQRDLSQSKESA